jgi:hypothetical protein
MDFFQVNHPIRKIGQDEYVIGPQPLNPLVKVKGSKIIVDEIDVSSISLKTGLFNSSSMNTLDLKTGDIDFLFFNSGLFSNVSGNLINTKTGSVDFLSLRSGHFIGISGSTLNLNGLDVYQELYNLNYSTVNTGTFLDNKINSISGILDYKIQNSPSNSSGVILENYHENRILLEEAFEYDEFGDVVPTNHPYISDPMWILKDDNNLELRANIWRFDNGPDAFTKDISF